MELLSVEIRTTPDEWDTVDLGEYVPNLPPLKPYGRPERIGAPWWAIIDRKVRGDWHGDTRDCRWFVGPWQNYEGTKDTLARRYVSQDYERMEAGLHGQWWPEFVYAVARVSVSGTVQTIRSGGIGGVESDAGEYRTEIAREELDALRETLREMGVPLDDWAELATAAGVDYQDEAA